MADTFAIDSKSKVFVSGLFWQPLSGTQAEYKKLTKKAVVEINNSGGANGKLDLAVWRTSPALQVGLGSSSDGVKPGMMSAAAVVSKAMESISDERDFLCAVEVPNGWLYVAQREGVILYNGDIIGTEDSIRARLLGDMSLSDWKVVVAPENWAIKGSIHKSFIDFLPTRKGKIEYKNWWEVKPIDRFSTISANPSKLVTPLMLIGAVGFGGYAAYQKWQSIKMAEEAKRLAVLNEPAQLPTATILEHPWKKEPTASEFVVSCVAGLKSINSLWPGNWEPQEATCANGNLSLSWKAKDLGWMDHLKTVEPAASFSTDGSTASITVPLKFKPDSEDDLIASETDRSYSLISAAQKYKLSVSLAPNETSAPTLPGQQDPHAPVKDWKEIKWTVGATLLSPMSIVAALDGSGFRVNRVQATFSNGIISWNMEGIQYVQP